MSSGQTVKPFLFFSRRCPHSTSLIKSLGPIINTLIPIDIDTPNINLPPFIQVVPTIYLPNEKRILTNEQLIKWCELMINGASQQQNSKNLTTAEITGDPNILAFQSNEMLSNSGSNYSFINDDDNELINRNFFHLDNRDVNKLPNFTKTSAPNGNGGDSTSSKKNGTFDKDYEALLAARQLDTPNPIGQMRV